MDVNAEEVKFLCKIQNKYGGEGRGLRVDVNQ